MKGFKIFTLAIVILTTQFCFGQVEKELFKSYGGNGNNCYGNTMMPSIYDTITDKVEVRAGYTYLKRIPPVYDTIVQKILVRPGYTRYQVVEPLFDIKVEKVKVHDQDTELKPGLVSKPRVFADQVETIPVRKIWTKTKKRKNCRSRIPENCLDWEVKELPSQRLEVTREVPSTILGGQANVTDIPEKFVTIQKKVLKREASVKEVNILPEYRTVRQLKIKTPARYEEVKVPPAYKEIKRIRIITEGGTIEPQEVVCEDDYGSYVLPIQLKLQERGYQVGELDGVLGRKTKAALIQYQIDHNLPIGQLDFATIKKLGLMR